MSAAMNNLKKNFNTTDEIPCDLDNPCRNGGTYDGTKLNYQCSCADCYTGTNCESKWELIQFFSPSPMLQNIEVTLTLKIMSCDINIYVIHFRWDSL